MVGISSVLKFPCWSTIFHCIIIAPSFHSQMWWQPLCRAFFHVHLWPAVCPPTTHVCSSSGCIRRAVWLAIVLVCRHPASHNHCTPVICKQANRKHSGIKCDIYMVKYSILSNVYSQFWYWLNLKCWPIWILYSAEYSSTSRLLVLPLRQGATSSWTRFMAGLG